MLKKVITNLDLSKASGPDCVPVVVLKNCEPELSYIQAELFNKCRSLAFQIVGRFHWWFTVLKNVGDRSTAKNYHLHILNLMEFQVRYLALFLLFSVIEWFRVTE